MAPNFRPRRFRDRPDEFDVRPERGGWRGEAPPRPLSLAQRDYKTIARLQPVDFTNVANALDRRRANGPMALVQKGKHEASRASQAISAAKSSLAAVSRFRAAAQRAKPIGADRRMFNPTSGPKTFYGTFARVESKAGGRFRFVLPAHVVPCVQRATRREVLFAKGHGGKGFKSRKRRGPNSHIGC